MANNDSNSASAAAITIILIVVSLTAMFVGSQISAPDQIRVGRNQGIMLCSEKPEQCKIEYQYLKLKENQK